MAKHGSKQILITCEHGGNEIPMSLASVFEGHETVVQSHEGWDRGALDTAQIIANYCNATLFYEKISRLVIEQNRSLNHPSLFSRFTTDLPEPVKSLLIRDIYNPYHRTVDIFIKNNTKTGTVYHFSVHSFTPVLHGVPRDTDIGLLYDPQRELETGICAELSRCISTRIPNLTIKENYPYKGTDDGLTTTLRSTYSDTVYSGIEIEINQKLITGSESWHHLQSTLAECIFLL